MLKLVKVFCQFAVKDDRLVLLPPEFHNALYVDTVVYVLYKLALYEFAHVVNFGSVSSYGIFFILTT